MTIVEKSLGDYIRDGETEAQKGKTRCPITHSSVAELAASSFQVPQGLSLWSLLGRREVKWKGAGGRAWVSRVCDRGTQQRGLVWIPGDKGITLD